MITKDQTIGQVLQVNPKAAQINELWNGMFRLPICTS